MGQQGARTASVVLPATAETPEVEVRRSVRRRRTVSAYRDGPRVVVMSLMKPVPGTNQRSMVIEMGHGCSQRRWNARNFPVANTTSVSPTTVNC